MYWWLVIGQMVPLSQEVTLKTVCDGIDTV